MTDAHISSDHLLARLRKRAAVARTAESNVSLHPDQVLALVECAEILRELRYTPVGDQSQAEIDAFWNRVHTAVDKMEAL